MEGLLHQAGQMTVFMSTHDLSDIESFATDIAFIDSGRLIFQETMDSLRSRFREVHVTVEDAVAFADAPPPGWMRLRRSGSVLTFVDSQYSEAKLAADLRHLEPNVRHMEAKAIDLRTIFTTLARAARDAGDLKNGGYA
jgi:ABC-2 type transport system ATP-binding protein